MRRALLTGAAFAALVFVSAPAVAAEGGARYPGGFIMKPSFQPTRTNAPGVWRMTDVLANIKAHRWPGASLSVESLLVGGGAGGGAAGVSTPQEGGGGGAGDVAPFTDLLGSGVYPVVVGPKGVGQFGDHGTNGGSSTFNGHTAAGGGYGGLPGQNAANGASGGGTGNVFVRTPGTGTGANGHNGAQGTTSGGASGFGTGGGGGGAGGAGAVPAGGAGLANSISGASVTYGVGGPGGGGIASATPGSGGYGNGPGLGGGPGGDGVNGIVIIRYQGPQQATGGTITTITVLGVQYTVHTFTTNGTFTLS